MLAAPQLDSLASVAPLVLPVGGGTYEGYIVPSSHRAGRGPSPPASLWLRVSGLPAGGAPSLRGARLEVGSELAALLGSGGHGTAAVGEGLAEQQRELLAGRLAEAPSLPAFLRELQNLVDQRTLEREAAAASTSGSSSCPAAFYSGLKAELDALGWRHISSLADDLSSLTLVATDAAGRRHALRLSLPPGYPAAPPAASTDLPAVLELRWGQAGASLAGALAQFEAALQQHQFVWDSLDDLDANAWVIEPTAPPRSVLYRRIALGNHASLALTLDSARPGALPTDCRFMGSAATVAPLRRVLRRQRLHDNRGRWQEGRPLRENLEAVLELALPQPAGAGAEDASADCAICYAYRLPPPEGAPEGEEGEAPDVSCDNAACGKPFHRRCLVEWLNSDTSTRQSFNMLFGACPYCSAPITVKVA